MQEEVWELKVSGLYRTGEGPSTPDPNATYWMRAELLDHWAPDTNWLRHLVPSTGKGFIFVCVTLKSCVDGTVTIQQDWELTNRTGGKLHPCSIPVPFENRILDFCENDRFSWHLQAGACQSSLMVFDVGGEEMPANLTVVNGWFGGKAQLLIQATIDESYLQFVDRVELKDLDQLQAEKCASQVGAFDVKQDSEGNTVLLYVERRGGNDTLLWFSKRGSGSTVWSNLAVCEIPHNITSVAFLDDSGGVYWVAIATRNELERSNYVSLDNMSIWLCRSDDRGRTWSMPYLQMTHVDRHEVNRGFFDLVLLEDRCGDFWMVWNHLYRRGSPTMYIVSRDRGLSWSGEPLAFESGSSYYESFTDVDGVLWLVYKTALNFDRGFVNRIASVDCGMSWGDPAYLLPYQEVPTAKLFKEQIPAGPYGEGWSRLWMIWVNRHSDLGPALDWSFVFEYSDDGGCTWHTFGRWSYDYDARRHLRLVPQSCRDEVAGRYLDLFWQDSSGSIYCASLGSIIAEPLALCLLVFAIAGALNAGRAHSSPHPCQCI